MIHTQSSHGNFRRRLLLAMAMLPALAFAAPGKPAEISMLEAINQAGRQRMLSQRMAKLYAQKLINVRADDATLLIGKSVDLFEQQLDTLSQVAERRNASSIQDTYRQLGELWKRYKPLVSSAPSQAGLQQVASMNEQMLALAQQGTVQFETLNGSSLGKLVNIAGRERMLSQRLSKFYFFEACGLKSDATVQALETARKEFVANLQILGSAPQNTRQIQAWIDLAQTQWMFFDEALNGGAREHEVATLESNVAAASENILQVMDQLAGMYARLA